MLAVYDKLKKDQEVDYIQQEIHAEGLPSYFAKFYHHNKSLEFFLGSENSDLTRFLHNISHGQDALDKAAINFASIKCLKNIEKLFISVKSNLKDEKYCKVRKKLKNL